MAASDSGEDEEEQQSSSGDEDEDDSSSSDGSAASNEDDSDSDDASGGDEDDEDEDELKQARVCSDIQEMRLMVGEMEKIKQRLLFRLEREKQAKLEEANWQQQQQRLADEEEAQRQQQQQEEEAAAKKLREESKIAQEAAAQQQQQQSLPERSFVEIGVQTELSTASIEHEARMSHDAAEQSLQSPSASTQRLTGTASKQASVPTEGQSARLSLYDLGESYYGMQEPNASPKPKRESHQQQPQQSFGSALAPPVSRSRNVPAAPSEASDSDTFFIRRDSNRTSWQPDLPHHNDSFRRSQVSVLDPKYGGSEDEHIGSPTSQTGARTSKSAFQTLRSSILSSIHEGTSENAVRSTSAASIESSKLFESQRGRFGRSNLSNGDGDDAAKTDEQREQEAIQSLLFGR